VSYYLSLTENFENIGRHTWFSEVNDLETMEMFVGTLGFQKSMI